MSQKTKVSAVMDLYAALKKENDRGNFERGDFRWSPARRRLYLGKG